MKLSSVFFYHISLGFNVLISSLLSFLDDSGIYDDGRFPINMPLCASTGPVLSRCSQHHTSTGPVLANNGMFTGNVVIII